MSMSIEDLQKNLSNFIFTENITLKSFIDNDKPGKKTQQDRIQINGKEYPRFINEFWTSKQRKANSLHEVSYRACFKPQLPRFFIKKLTNPYDVVYDPFAGRGTTAIEAGLLGRNVISNDVNPLSKILTKPRFFIPKISDIEKRLDEIPWDPNKSADIDLSMFYHKKTESEIVSLKDYLSQRSKDKTEDDIDKWIRMVAITRLTGHSNGFFSVYTLPPNQAVTQKRQIKINEKRDQKPDYRNVEERIIRKSKSLLRGIKKENVFLLKKIGQNGLFLSDDARNTPKIKNDYVSLTVTSPPFLDIVQYSKDNWLRWWFNSIDADKIDKKVTMSKTIEDWSDVMGNVFRELFRITKPGGWVAFEVGEVKNGKIKLDNYVIPLGVEAGFRCAGILINSQEFTKTSNIWGVSNLEKGTNTNRIVVFKKEA